MRLKNETLWDSRSLRSMIRQCEIWLGVKYNVHYTVTYSRAGSFSGYAHYHGGPVTLRVPHPYGETASDKYLREHGTTVAPRVVDGAMRQELVDDLAWVTEHELLHVIGWTHKRMRKENHPAYKHWNTVGGPNWAKGLTVRVRPSAVETGPKPPEARANSIRENAEKRLAKDKALLAKWERKLKLATTKIKKLRRSIAARERRRATTNGGQSHEGPDPAS